MPKWTNVTRFFIPLLTTTVANTQLDKFWAKLFQCDGKSKVVPFPSHLCNAKLLKKATKKIKEQENYSFPAVYNLNLNMLNDTVFM